MGFYGAERRVDGVYNVGDVIRVTEHRFGMKVRPLCADGIEEDPGLFFGVRVPYSRYQGEEFNPLKKPFQGSVVVPIRTA